MVPILQLFEFGYPNGSLFFDRSGALARRLQEMIPGLTSKSAVFEQREFIAPTNGIELLFGPGLSGIQTVAPLQEEFPTTASTFLQAVTEVLEISQLSWFRFRYVIGRPCASDEEAERLLWPLVPQETRDRLATLSARKWQALQAEFLIESLACQSRIAVVNLPRKAADGRADTGNAIPHITFQAEFRGLAPIAVADFDAPAFMKNVRENQIIEILSKLAPHLS